MTAVLEDLIIQDFNEFDEVFEKRKEITLRLYKLNDISTTLALTCGRCFINKQLLGLSYDVEFENLLSSLNM